MTHEKVFGNGEIPGLPGDRPIVSGIPPPNDEENENKGRRRRGFARGIEVDVRQITLQVDGLWRHRGISRTSGRSVATLIRGVITDNHEPGLWVEYIEAEQGEEAVTRPQRMRGIPRRLTNIKGSKQGDKDTLAGPSMLSFLQIHSYRDRLHQEEKQTYTSVKHRDDQIDFVDHLHYSNPAH